MARKYQGHARRTGFQRRDPGYQSLNRMQQQGDRVIRGLEEDRQEQLRIEQNYAQSLDANFERAQQNRNELFNLQSRIDNNRMQAERNVAQQRVRDAKTEQRQVEIANRQLSQFSETLSRATVAAVDRVQEIKDKSAFSVSILDEPYENFRPTEEYQQRQEVLEAREEVYQQVGDNFTGVSEATVQQYRSDSPTRALGSLKTRIQKATADIPKFLTSYDQSPVQTYDLMEAYDLHGVNRYQLFDFAKKIQSHRSALQDREFIVKAKELSFERILQTQNIFLAEPSAVNLHKLVKDIARGTRNGRDPNGMEFAIEQVFGENGLLSNPSLIDTPTFNRIVKETNYPGAQGKTKTSILARHKPRIMRLMQVRDDKNIANSSRIEKLARVESANTRRSLEEEMDKKAAEGGEYPVDKYNEIIQRSDMVDDDKKKAFESNFDNSPQGQLNEDLLVEIQYRYNNGQDISELVPRLRGPEKAKWQDIVNKQKKALSNPEIPSNKELEKNFIQEARNVLTLEKNVSADSSYKTAGSFAFFEYLKLRKFYMESAPPLDAHLRAKSESEILLRSKTGKFALSEESADSPVGFTYFQPEGGYYKNIIKASGAEQLRLVRDNPEALDTMLIVPEEVLAARYKAIREGKPSQEAFLFRILAENGVHDAEQRQLNVYTTEKNLEPVKKPLSYKQYLSETAPTPKAQRRINTSNSNMDYHIALTAQNVSSAQDITLQSSRVRKEHPNILVDPHEGGITGLSIGDYQELAYGVSAEAKRGTDDEFAVAASIINRLADGSYGDSIYEILRKPGQYESVTNGTAYYDPALAARFASAEGQRKIRQMLVKLNGRTHFKGTSMEQNMDPTDPQYAPGGNIFHGSKDKPGSGPYKGPAHNNHERFYF